MTDEENSKCHKIIHTAAAAAIGGRTVSQFLVGWIPGLGNAINAGTAASITEGIGWYVAKNFSKEAEEKRIKLEAEEKARKEVVKRESEKNKSIVLPFLAVRTSPGLYALPEIIFSQAATIA